MSISSIFYLQVDDLILWRMPVCRMQIVQAQTRRILRRLIRVCTVCRPFFSLDAKHEWIKNQEQLDVFGQFS